MATIMQKITAVTLATAMAAVLGFGIGSDHSGARETAPDGAHAGVARIALPARADVTDPDRPRGRPWSSDGTPAVIAIDVVANYCLPTPCRPQ